MKIKKLILVVALLAAATVTAMADDEVGPAATACMMPQIGFKAAAPCMIRYMQTVGNAPNLQLAAQTAALDEQVRAGRVSNHDAYTRFVEIRGEIKRRCSARSWARPLVPSRRAWRQASRAQPLATATDRPCNARLGSQRESHRPANRYSRKPMSAK